MKNEHFFIFKPSDWILFHQQKYTSLNNRIQFNALVSIINRTANILRMNIRL